MIMPCYNEESLIGYTIPRLVNAFRNAGYQLELIGVDNGSADQTGQILQDLEMKNPEVIHLRVEVNEGYGNGVLNGIPLCTAPWIGIIPADGQVDAEDVVRLYEALVVTDGRVLGKVRRRFRMDGFRRKVVSVIYNLFFRILWPRMQSIDINGSPKILPRAVILSMDLKSKDWLLDPEIMIKAHHMGLRILELNVFARMRGSGISHVRMGTVWVFIWFLLKFRFSREWRKDIQNLPVYSKTSSPLL
jgi:glycosyltransferase involved in cell wall biosynthesis